MTPQDISKEFLSCNILSVSPLDGGHINETYLVKTANGRYVLQRINSHMYTSVLVRNFELYSPACDRSGLLYPAWIKTHKGDFFYTVPDGCHWRMYPYLDGEILSPPLSAETLYACGHGIARIHALLNTLQAVPQPVYPMLHDLPYYFDEYRNLLKGPHLIPDNRDADTEALISSGIDTMLHVTKEYAAPSVVHGDLKLANILFRDGQVIGFLDFDTVMTGYPEEDIADCIRSCCIREGSVDRDAASMLIRGYADISGDFEELSRRVRKAFRKICFELGLRYYTDAISEKKHFRVTAPEYRITKARNLLKLASGNSTE